MRAAGLGRGQGQELAGGPPGPPQFPPRGRGQIPSVLRHCAGPAFSQGPLRQAPPPASYPPLRLPLGCEVVPDVNVSGQKFCIKLLVPSPEGMSEIHVRCQDVSEGLAGVSPGPKPEWGWGQGRGGRTRARRAPYHPPLSLAPQEKQYAHWMAGCRLASKGRTMADSSYASEVQAILAFLSLQRTGGGGSGNHPPGPDASAEGLNPYGLVAPRFQRKFKAKQVPKEVGGGNDHGFYLATLGPWISTEPSSRKPRAHSFRLLPLSLRRSMLVPTPWEGSRRPGC